MFRSITNNTAKNLSAGGTISGDVTISGDLTVQGSATNTYDELIEGKVKIDQDANDFALEIDSENTTANAIIVECDALTSNGIARFYSNSSDTSSRSLVQIVNNHASATGAVPLRIEQNSTGAAAHFVTSNNQNDGLIMEMSGTSSGGSYITFQYDENASAPSETGDLHGGIRFRSAYSNDTYSGYGASITSSSEGGPPSASQSPGNLVFSTTATSSTTLVERMKITPDGNVGIGTGSNDIRTKLHIETTANSISSTDVDVSELPFIIMNPANDDNEAVGIGFGVSQTTTNIGAAIIHDRDGSNSYGNLHFATKPNGGAGGADIPIRMTISESGNVGIGTSSPSDYHSLADNLVVASSGDTGISIVSGTTSDGRIFFADGTSGGDESRGHIRYNHDDNSMHFVTNDAGSTSALAIDSSQNATFAGDVKVTDNLIIDSTAGDVTKQKIQFHDDNVGLQRASGSNRSNNGNSLYISAFEDIVFTASGAAMASQTERMRITDDGNVRIGSDLTSVTSDTHLAIGDSGDTHFILGEDVNNHARITWDASEDALDFNLKDGGTGTVPLILDTNSRISLSNNDSGSHNTIFGYQSANSIASGGDYNVVFGDNALYTEDTGDKATAIGYSALYSQNVGSGTRANTGVGLEVLKFNVTGTNNTAIGHEALLGASGNSHSNNTGVGYQSLKSVTSGSDNVALGASAGDAVTSQSNLTLVGKNAGGAINDDGADGSVAVGSGCLGSLTSGADNVAIGMNAMFKVNTGHDNVALGKNAGFYATTAGFNTFIGKESAQGINAIKLTGDNNVAVGYRSGYNMQGSSASNVIVGSLAGDAITTGTSNVIVGQNSDISDVDGTNQIVIGQGVAGVEDNSVTLGNSSVTKVYMGNTSGKGTATVHCTGIRNNFRDAVSVGTSATAIGEASQYGALAMVWMNSGGNIAHDLVSYSLSDVDVVASQNISGSPAARTYSAASGVLKVAMASGTYDVYAVEIRVTT